MTKHAEKETVVRWRTSYAARVMLCAVLTLLLACAALFLDNAPLRAAAVLACAALLILCLTAGLREHIRLLRSESARILSDCTRAREQETLLRRKSELDPLTQTLNRSAFFERARAYLDDERQTHAFLMLDLDGFKQINDTCGHDAGDRTLVEVAESIRSVLRPADLLCRIGGDEFAVLLLSVADDTVITRRAGDIRNAVRRTVDGRMPLSASIGAAVFPRDGRQVSVLYAKADRGLYRSKRGGKDAFTFFDPQTLPLLDLPQEI